VRATSDCQRRNADRLSPPAPEAMIRLKHARGQGFRSDLSQRDGYPARRAAQETLHRVCGSDGNSSPVRLPPANRARTAARIRGEHPDCGLMSLLARASGKRVARQHPRAYGGSRAQAHCVPGVAAVPRGAPGSHRDHRAEADDLSFDVRLIPVPRSSKGGQAKGRRKLVRRSSGHATPPKRAGRSDSRSRRAALPKPIQRPLRRPKRSGSRGLPNPPRRARARVQSDAHPRNASRAVVANCIVHLAAIPSCRGGTHRTRVDRAIAGAQNEECYEQLRGCVRRTQVLSGECSSSRFRQARPTESVLRVAARRGS
jgi:hypothetical protein